MPAKRQLLGRAGESGADSGIEGKASRRKGGSIIRGRRPVHSALFEKERLCLPSRNRSIENEKSLLEADWFRESINLEKLKWMNTIIRGVVF